MRYALGRKTGTETRWSPDGQTLWTWEHAEDGKSVWTQYWPNGRKKAESNWHNFMANGEARKWNHSGQLVSEATLRRGKMEGPP